MPSGHTGPRVDSKPEWLVMGTMFGPFRALFRSFSVFFLFILSNSSVRATSRYDRLTNLIFDTESLYDTITWGFQRFLKICISAPFRGPFIFKKGPKSQKT